MSSLNYNANGGSSTGVAVEGAAVVAGDVPDLDYSRLPYLQPCDLLSISEASQQTFRSGKSKQESGPDIIEQRNWWVLHTKSRQEKKVAEQLAAKNVAHFLPTVERKSLSRGKVRTAKIPLFTGYLFLWGSDHNRVQALQTNRICSIDRVVEGENLQRDLSAIARLIALDAPLSAEAKYAVGQRVRVKAGMFIGFEGNVLKRSGKTRLFVAIDYMKMGASMEIQDYLLEPI